jgi:hypothetical protein
MENPMAISFTLTVIFVKSVIYGTLIHNAMKKTGPAWFIYTPISLYLYIQYDYAPPIICPRDAYRVFKGDTHELQTCGFCI